RLLLARDGLLAWSLAGPGIRVRPLPADRKVPAVPHAAVATDVHQSLDVHRRVLPQIALDLDVVRDDLADPDDLLLGEVLDPRVGPDVGLLEDVIGLRPPDPVDVGQPDLDALVERKIHARDACHGATPVSVCAWASCR